MLSIYNYIQAIQILTNDVQMLIFCLSHFINTVLEIYNFPHYFPTNYVWYRSCSILWQKRLFSLEFLSNIQG